MENGREITTNLPEESGSKKKRKRAKNFGKNEKAAKSSHSKKKIDPDWLVEDADKTGKQVSNQEDVQNAESSMDALSRRKVHSKSRSRSASRSRFSAIFKRKKRSKSETDLGYMYEAKDVAAGDAAPSSTDVSQGKLKTNLKKTLPYYAFDSRVQPRDRLMNMTVKDALKEQKLRRSHSSSMSPHRRRHDRESRVSAPSDMEINDFGRNADAASSLPRLSKASILSSDPERSAFYKYPSNPEFKKHMVGISSQGESRDSSFIAADSESLLSQRVASKTLEPQQQRFLSEDVQLTEKGEDIESYIREYVMKSGQASPSDPHTDGEDTKTLVNVSISSQDEEPVDVAKPIAIPHKSLDEHRKASLTKFLELRQQPPPSLTRNQRVGQHTRDSVSPRDFSQTHEAIIEHEVDAVKIKPSPASAIVSRETKANDSVHYPTAPRVSLNGANLETSDSSSSAIVPSIASIVLEDSAVDSSSLSSSPQINSMASSFRSSDQGYAESGDESSEENSAFSTPPEEAEPNHSKLLTMSVLQKLLDPIKEKQKTRFSNEVVQKSGIKESQSFPVKMLEPNSKAGMGDSLSPQPAITSGQRYIPRGVRRSKSDAGDRRKPYRRFFRNTSSPPGKSKMTGESLNSTSDTPTANLESDVLSAVSSFTLTGTDSLTGLTGKGETETGKLENKALSFSSSMTGLKYKRSFSPSRTKRSPSAAVSSDTLTSRDTSSDIIPSKLSLDSPRPALHHSSSSSEKREISKSSPGDGQTSRVNAENHRIIPQPDASKSEPKRYEKRKEDTLRDLPASFPDIEIVLNTTVDNKPFKCDINLTKKDTTSKLEDFCTPKTSPAVMSPDTKLQLPAYGTALGKESQKPLPLFPIFHGLEVGRHRQPSAPKYSLADYIQEQSLVSYSHKHADAAKTDEIKTPLVRKTSFKRKSKKDRKDYKREKKVETADEHLEGEAPTGHTPRAVESTKFKVMVDKQVQTSSWLLNTLSSKKTPKMKKKSQSAARKTKRRDSSASDTFIPNELPKFKEAYQRSSLCDLRAQAKIDSPGIIDFASLGAAPTRKTGILKPQPIVACTSSGAEAIKPDPYDPPHPKTKKLSLTAVILLKNRLARFREKKRKEKGQKSDPGAEFVSPELPSDTMVTIENEINLSKLEISKETDIVDDIFEPEFSLDYTKKHIRFDPMPSELMQSEEPLPPLLPSSSRRLRQRRESTMRERRRKCVHHCKTFVAFLFSHIGLCSLVVAYTILGGFIFRALEDTVDMSVRNTITVKRERTVEQLVSLAVDYKQSEPGLVNLTQDVNNTIVDYQRFIQKLTKEKGWDGVEGEHEEGPWTFASALLYAITVTTTIGYGHVAPKTAEGRIVTIGYAVVGIPLTLLCLTNIGDVMATGFRLLYGKICCGLCCTMFKPRRRRLHVDIEKGLGGPLVTTTEEEQPDKPKEVIHVPTSLCLLLIAAYICSGAMLFSSWENWDYLSAAYFCFITLSTIGFGDIVPGMDNNAWAQEEKLVLCALYLVLGLSLIAMCFNLVQEDVKVKCRWLGMKLGIVEKPEAPI